MSSTGEAQAVLPGPAWDSVNFEQDSGKIMYIKDGHEVGRMTLAFTPSTGRGRGRGRGWQISLCEFKTGPNLYSGSGHPYVERSVSKNKTKQNRLK